MPINSKRKGATGERELASKFREYGYDCRRGQQFCGANGDADVVGLPGIHVEVKRTEALRLYDALAQAKHDAAGIVSPPSSGVKAGEYDYGEFVAKKPAVFHRKNDCSWVVIMELSDWIELYREWEAGNEQPGISGHSQMLAGYNLNELIATAELLRSNAVSPSQLHNYADGLRLGMRIAREQQAKSFNDALARME